MHSTSHESHYLHISIHVWWTGPDQLSFAFAHHNGWPTIFRIESKYSMLVAIKGELEEESTLGLANTKFKLYDLINNHA